MKKEAAQDILKMTEKVKRKLNGAASKMLATITGRTIQEEARSPVKLRQTYTRDAFRRRTKPKHRKRY